MLSYVGQYFAPMFWGFVCSTFLVGATLIQGYTYFNRNRDRTAIRVAIMFMLLLDLASTVVMSMTIDHYFVVNFGIFAAFGSIPPEWVLEMMFTALVTFIAQIFFATRIQIVMQHFAVFGPWERLIPGVIVCTAIITLGAGIGKTVIIATLPPIELGGEQMLIVACLEEGLAFVSDACTTCTLTYILTSAREGLRRKKSPIRRLLIFTLNRGILVTMLQIGTLIAFVTARGYMYWMPFHLCKSKLYTNTLLAMLNSRRSIEANSVSRTSHVINRRTAQSSSIQGDTTASHISFQNIPNDGSGDSVTPDEAQVRAWEGARVNWDPPPRAQEDSRTPN